MTRESARERAYKRWRRYPVELPLNAPLGEEVTRYPVTAWEVEWLAAHGPLVPGEMIPSERGVDV